MKMCICVDLSAGRLAESTATVRQLRPPLPRPTAVPLSDAGLLALHLALLLALLLAQLDLHGESDFVINGGFCYSSVPLNLGETDRWLSLWPARYAARALHSAARCSLTRQAACAPARVRRRGKKKPQKRRERGKHKRELSSGRSDNLCQICQDLPD